MKVICIVGATGTGKNNLAIEIAKKFKGEIINFDSRQVYDGFPIITAQPLEEEKRVCSHHLYGFLDLNEKISAGEFAELAHKKINEVTERGNLPILVGGTGLYLKAILFGLAKIPKIPEEIRKRIIEEYNIYGPLAMYKRLTTIDPDYAKKIHPRDKQRITRALEVFEATKKNLTWYHNSYPTTSPKYDYLKLGIWMDKDILEHRLKRRIDIMLDLGGIDEVKRAWEMCSDTTAPVWTSIGCKELLDYVRGKLSLDEAIKRWLQNTKKYAKRQVTWFKKEKDIKWIKDYSIEDVLKQVESFLDDNKN